MPYISLKRSIVRSLQWPKIAILLTFLYIYGAITFVMCVLQLLGPVGGMSSTEEIIQIRRGMDVIRIGSLLAEKGFIKSALIFQLSSILTGTSRSLKAGDYIISTSMSLPQILHKIVSGESVLYRFTIPEGFTTSEIAMLWEEKGFGTADAFNEALNDRALIETIDKDSDSLEGYLFPDTYMFPHGISEREAISTMLRQFDTVFHTVSSNSSPSAVKLSRHQIVSLASIIEKEAKADEERPLISAVFYNRLKLDKKLESCVTVLYGLGYPNRKLTFDDLRNANSFYNTYIYKGLPPGPICNPGLKSIIAALNPSNERYLYFVSKNDGTHYFTDSFSDFLNAKRKYQGVQKK